MPTLHCNDEVTAGGRPFNTLWYQARRAAQHSEAWPQRKLPRRPRRPAGPRVDEDVRRRRRGPRRELRPGPRSLLRAARSLRVRQDHPAEAARRVRGSDGGGDPPRRSRNGWSAGLPSPAEHCVPSGRTVSSHERREERRVCAASAAAAIAQDDDRVTRQRRAQAGPARPPRHSAYLGAVGRSAAARRFGAGGRRFAEHPLAGRAALGARRPIAGRHAGRAEVLAGQARHLVRVRHSRPERSAVHGGSHRCPAGRPTGPGQHSVRHL